jgi:hypothetical protein
MALVSSPRTWVGINDSLTGSGMKKRRDSFLLIFSKGVRERMRRMFPRAH